MPESERKARLIQTRVAEDLDEALREEARKKRVTVSQLIRNVLEDTFHLVDNIVAETASFTETVRRDARRIAASAQGRAKDFDTTRERVYAWQEVVLNREGHCARCEAPLRRGDRGLLGLEEDYSGPPRVWLCLPCRDTLQSG